MQKLVPHPSRLTAAVVMAKSKLFRDYQVAFASACGLVPELRHADASTMPEWPITDIAPSNESLDSGKHSVAVHRFFKQKLARTQNSPPSYESHNDRHSTFIPVRTGNRVLAVLFISRFPLQPPTREEVEKLLQLTGFEAGSVKAEQIETVVRQARAMSSLQYASLVRLLEIFSGRLADWYTWETQHAPGAEPDERIDILRAKEWIEEHYHERLTLTKVARTMHMSAQHFCRKFSRVTGIKFRDFVTLTRVNRAQRLLANPATPIAEAAYASGFQGISQFNRSFRKLVGQTPSEFRITVAKRHAADGTLES